MHLATWGLIVYGVHSTGSLACCFETREVLSSLDPCFSLLEMHTSCSYGEDNGSPWVLCTNTCLSQKDVPAEI